MSLGAAALAWGFWAWLTGAQGAVARMWPAWLAAGLVVGCAGAYWLGESLRTPKP